MYLNARLNKSYCYVTMETDQMSASQLITDLDVMTFNKEDKVMPQVSNMTENIYYGRSGC